MKSSAFVFPEPIPNQVGKKVILQCFYRFILLNLDEDISLRVCTGRLDKMSNRDRHPPRVPLLEETHLIS
jgi:hypothetical protein